MSIKRQTALILAVTIFVGLGILAYELSWYVSDVAVRVLLAMAIPGCIASVISRLIPDKETIRYYDPYIEQHKKEEEQEERDRKTPQVEMETDDKLNWKQNSDRTITL